MSHTTVWDVCTVFEQDRQVDTNLCAGHIQDRQVDTILCAMCVQDTSSYAINLTVSIKIIIEFMV